MAWHGANKRLLPLYIYGGAPSYPHFDGLLGSIPGAPSAPRTMSGADAERSAFVALARNHAEAEALHEEAG
jgi:hypothetical protein